MLVHYLGANYKPGNMMRCEIDPASC
jgi:hypothetical protein